MTLWENKVLMNTSDGLLALRMLYLIVATTFVGCLLLVTNSCIEADGLTSTYSSGHEYDLTKDDLENRNNPQLNNVDTKPLEFSKYISSEGLDGKYGGTLIVGNRGDPPYGFDSLRTSSIALNNVSGAIFGPGNLVMRCREDIYVVCPYLATKWISNQDFTEWTFNIRQDVFWHDGTPLVVEDLKFWFDIAFFGVQIDDAIRAPAYFSNELGKIDSVNILDHNRLMIRLANRNPFLPDILANPRFKVAHPRHLMYDRLVDGEISVSPVDVGLIGLGPFRFKDYERGSSIRLERFHQYWEESFRGDSLPYLDNIEYVIIPEPYMMDVAFRTGKIDVGARGQAHYLTTDRKQGYDRDLGADVIFGNIEGGSFRLAFNVLREGPWNDSRVRRAISLWIDKQAAIPAVLGGFGWTSPDLGPPDIPIQRHFINWPKFDVGSTVTKRAEARRLMDEAGYTGGFSMGHLCRALNTLPCEFLKDQLKGLGIDLQLQVVDEGEWNRARISLDYDSQQGRLSHSHVPESTESVYGRFENNPDAYSKHDDVLVDGLYKELRNATTFDARMEAWRSIEHYVFVEQTYVIPIAEYINVLPYRSYVKGLVIPIEDSHTHTDLSTVWLDW